MGFRRAAHVAWRRVGDETVLIHLRDKKIYVLNPSGGFFWHALDGARGTDDLLEGLSLKEPLPEEASSGLDAFWKKLEEADLVESSGSKEEAPSRPAEETPYPFPSFVAPQLVWQEELRNFGQSCAFIAGSSAACDAIPTT